MVLVGAEGQASPADPQPKPPADTTPVPGPAAWPDLQQDRLRMREMSRMLADPDVLQNRPARAVRLCRNLTHIRRYRQEMAEKYQALIGKDGPLSRELAAELNTLAQRVEKFQAAAEKFAEAAPAALGKIFKSAHSLIGQAREQQSGKAFISELPGRMERSANLISMLTVLRGAAHPTVRDAQQKQQILSEKVTEARQVLRAAIIRDNVAPETRYQGANRTEILENFHKVWAKNHPDDEILDVRIPAANWEQHSGWRWMQRSKKWRRYDYSELHALIAVKADAEYVHLYDARCIQEGTGEVLRRYRIKPKAESLPPNRILLLENWK